MKKALNPTKKRITNLNCSKSNEESKLSKIEFKINGFNIIELIEDEVEYNETIVNSEEDDEINKLSLKEKNSLINVSKKCENYFSNQFGDIFINISCLKCHLSNFHTNELLYFPNRKTLLKYLKYAFLFLKKKLFIDHSIYINNKYDLEKCDNSYLINWKFFISKSICKYCFMEIINMKMLFGNLKTIFCDVEKETYLKEIQSKKKGHRYKKQNNKNKKKIKTQKKKFILNKENNNSLIANFYNINISYNSENNSLIIKKSALGDLANEIFKNKNNEGNIKDNNIEEQKDIIENQSKNTINNFHIINNVNYKDIYKNNILSFNDSWENHNILDNINDKIINNIKQIINLLIIVLNYLHGIRNLYSGENSYKINNIENYLKQLFNLIINKMLEVKQLYEYVMKNIINKMINRIVSFHVDNNLSKEILDNMTQNLYFIENNLFDFIKNLAQNINIFWSSFRKLINNLNDTKERLNSKLYKI